MHPESRRLLQKKKIALLGLDVVLLVLSRKTQTIVCRACHVEELSSKVARGSKETKMPLIVDGIIWFVRRHRGSNLERAPTDSALPYRLKGIRGSCSRAFYNDKLFHKVPELQCVTNQLEIEDIFYLLEPALASQELRRVLGRSPSLF